ncbi:flavin monoamine oxidase family protein, partial [Streptomyces sp. NPDC058662]|uniref:flavin monoamine oxidase family protein n=1 Tax=Streptomyces sp. NPDC058662 TaxID=3346583 RepID=UPI0036537435
MRSTTDRGPISATANAASAPHGTATHLPRRTLLKAAGTATLAAAAGLAVAGPAAAEGRRDYDVIVVGAGLAGVTAARELRAQGKRVLLLEARDRIGGRTWTDTFRGQQIERGGTWVDRRQPHVWRELNRYRIPIIADTGVDRAILPTLTGFQEYDPTEAYERQNQLFTPFFDGATQAFDRPYEPFHQEALVRDMDQYSLRDRLDQLNYAPEDEIRLTSTTSLFGGSSRRGAFSHLAQWWALAGGTFEEFHGLNTFRPQTGTISLVQAILKDAAPTLKLNSPVASVVQKGGRARVTTRSGAEYQAAEVIMAVPVNVWKTIQFDPPLPESHRLASGQGFGVPHEKKLWLTLRRPADRFIAEAPEGYPICIMGRLNEGQDVVAFSVKDSFDVSSRAQVDAAVKQIIPDAELVDYTATDWHTDEFALGVGVFRQPFQLTRLHRDINRPFGRVKFAGGDIADGWSGYMDGAIESGLRVAGSPTLNTPAPAVAAGAAGFAVPPGNRRHNRSLRS